MFPFIKYLLLSFLILVTSLQAADVTNEEQLQLAGSIHVIFERKCNECHGSHLKKPEGKFGYVLELQRLADNPDYIVRGKPKSSDLFRMVRDEEMPPDDHPKTPPLTAHEKDLVRRWIEAGATSTLPVVLPKLPEEKLPATVVATHTEMAKDRANKGVITLNIKQCPAGEIFAEIEKQSGIPVIYAKPRHEPQLSIQLKNGTVFEALNYLALCGNFSLTFNSTAALIGPNPPPVSAAIPKEGKVK